MFCARRSPGSGLGMLAWPPSQREARRGWMLWHTRDNPAPEGSAVCKIPWLICVWSIKGDYMTKMWSPSPLERPPLLPHGRLSWKWSIPEKKPKKNAECFFICKPAWIRTKIHLVQYEPNFHPKEGRGKPVEQLDGGSSPGQVLLCPAAGEGA